MATVVNDTWRFVSQNFEVIYDHSTEVYRSALVWTPTKSIIRERFKSLMADLPIVRCGLLRNWGPMELTIPTQEVVTSVAFSPDGNRVVSGSWDSTVRIWNASTGQPESILEGHSNWVDSVAFSHDGTRVVSGSYDDTVRIWNMATGRQESVLEGHSRSVYYVAFSRDGTRVVSGSEDNTVRIWNVATGRQESVVDGNSKHTGSISLASNSPDNSSQPSPPVTHSPSSLIAIQDFWISDMNTGNKCWIPPSFRDWRTTAQQGSQICLGCGSGRVVILDMSPVRGTRPAS